MVTHVWRYIGIPEKMTFTSIEENFGAVQVFSCTGDMQRRSIVAVMRLHQSSTVNHELNALGITCFDTSLFV